MKVLSGIKAQLSSFHNDERGVEVLQGIMLLAVGALAVIALIAFGKQGMEWLWKKFGDIFGEAWQAAPGGGNPGN